MKSADVKPKPRLPATFSVMGVESSIYLLFDAVDPSVALESKKCPRFSFPDIELFFICCLFILVDLDGTIMYSEARLWDYWDSVVGFVEFEELSKA